jgi:hypothetical protein
VAWEIIRDDLARQVLPLLEGRGVLGPDGRVWQHESRYRTARIVAYVRSVLHPPLDRIALLGSLKMLMERGGATSIAAASALFQVVNQRYLKTSIMLTTNRPITSWGEILGDTTVAAALLDRLHRSVVLDITGESYRLRDHHARTDGLKRANHATSPRRPKLNTAQGAEIR